MCIFFALLRDAHFGLFLRLHVQMIGPAGEGSASPILSRTVSRPGHGSWGRGRDIATRNTLGPEDNHGPLSSLEEYLVQS